MGRLHPGMLFCPNGHGIRLLVYFVGKALILWISRMFAGNTIRGSAPAVDCVVVVDIARGVDVPRIVTVATVGGPQSDVLF